MPFEITDKGDFVDGIYNTKAASYVYSMLIGRKTQPIQNKKNDFTEADIIFKGYLNKEGSWVKSWKTRYFLLRSDIRELCYYTSKEDMTLIGSVKIDKNTFVWTNREEDDQLFILSRSPPKGSDEEKREIRLRAPDSATKYLWMEHIAEEAARTKDIVLRDWWIDLFNDIHYQRKGDEIEFRKKTNTVLSGMKKFSLIPSSSPKGNQPETMPAVSETSELSDTPAAQDDMDARAEQLALKVINKMRDRRNAAGGGITSMGGLFAGMDEELDEVSDDSVDGDTSFVDDPEDKQLDREHKKTIVDKIVHNDDEEEDIEEDFVFSRVSIHPGEERNDREKRCSRDSKDSDDESNSDEEDDRRRQGSKESRIRSVRHLAIRRSGTKTKKEKTFGPPPLLDTNADRFDCDGQVLKGLCINVELVHVLEGNEKISCTLSKANLNEGTDWKVVGHTENYKLEEEKLSSSNAAHAHRIVHQFHLLQDPSFLEESTHALVILNKTSKNVTKGQKKKGDGIVPVCSGVFRCDELLATGGITKVKMNMSTLRNNDISSPHVSKEEYSYNNSLPDSEKADYAPVANLGVVLLSSALIHQRRMKLISDMRCRPYGENMFAFRSINGQSMVLEQVFASRYSLSVARAMLGLIIPERKHILSETKRIVKHDLKTAISALKNIPSKAALQELDDMLTGGGELDGKNTIETVSKAESLQRTKNLVKGINKSMMEGYRDCEEHCLQALEGEVFPGMVISPEVGGSQLRRSVWKKSPVWQFCTTNLNVNLITWRRFNNNELKVGAHVLESDGAKVAAEGSSPSPKLSTAATVTFGAPSAHGFGFNDGGIRRMMAGLGSHEATRLKWMCLLQATGGVSMDLLERSTTEAREFRKLFDVNVDMATGDGWTTLFQKASKLAMRIDACCAQALGFAIASIKTVLTLASYGEDVQYTALANAFAMQNFLLPVECFLSTQGHEMGMLEDLEASILWLSSVKVRFVSSDHQRCRTQKSSRRSATHTTLSFGKEVYIGVCDDICIHRDADKGTLICDIEVNASEIQTIKKALKTSASDRVDVADIKAEIAVGAPENGKQSASHSNDSASTKDVEVIGEFGLTGVVFTCGVNEMQSLVNLSGGKEAYKQAEINNEAYERLSNYLVKYNSCVAAGEHNTKPKHKPKPKHRFDKNDEDLTMSQLFRKLSQELRATLDAAQASPHVKTPGILIRSAQICRMLSGTVGILCKSGKDRTSMGVTLEQSCILSRDDPLVDGQEATRVMRKYGVRRMNVYANTGQGCYAFNSFQQQMLPVCYRPPGGTYGGNVAS